MSDEASGRRVRRQGTDRPDLSPLVNRTGAESDSGTVTGVVVEALAEAEGTVPTELTPPLYEAVDPDALDRLFETGGDRAGGRVEFSYADYRVTVTVDDNVSVCVYTAGRRP